MENIIHVIKIPKLTKQSSLNGYTNVITEVNWVLISYREDIPDIYRYKSGKISLNTPGSDFIDYYDLKEENVASWIETIVPDFSDIKSQHEQEINEELGIAETPEELSDLPWEADTSIL